VSNYCQIWRDEKGLEGTNCVENRQLEWGSGETDKWPKKECPILFQAIVLRAYC